MEGNFQNLLAAQEATSIENAALATRLMEQHAVASVILRRIDDVTKIVDRLEAMGSSERIRRQPFSTNSYASPQVQGLLHDCLKTIQNDARNSVG